MKAEEVMAILHDGTVNQWQEIANRLERLNAMLLAEQIKTAGLVAELDNERAAHQSERDDWRADFDRLTSEIREAQETALRDRNRLVFVAQRMPMFVAEWLSLFTPFKDEALTAEVVEAKKHAHELLKLLEPFAG
jgi:chromosome segregation ATPase